MRKVGRLAIAMLGMAAALPVCAAEPSITPRPLRVVATAGPPITLGNGTRLVGSDDDARQAARYLADLAARSGGPHFVPASTAGTGIVRFVRRAGLADQAYTLDIDATGATIAASSRAGFVYGAVSLWQLLSATPSHSVARTHIEDAPRFAWRGLVLDSVRHFQSPADVERTIDWMAIHKLNRLQWHLADDQGWRLEVGRHPRLTSVGAWRTTPPAAGLTPGRYGGFYSRADVRRIVAFAAMRGITVVPEIEMPGHATAAILAYPAVGLTTATPANLGDWGVFPSIYGVDGASFDFLKGVLDEVIALFPSREIAIGGDEAVHTLWHNSPAVQAKMHALGLTDEAALQGWFVGQIGRYLNAHGRRLVGWDEILADKALAKDDIVLSWHGADGAIAAARAGHDVVMATAPTLYLDNRQSAAPSEPPGRGTVVTLADIYAYDPGDPPHAAGTPGLDAEGQRHVLGVQGALWSEHIATEDEREAMALPRAAALAEIGWSAKDRRDWSDFAARLPAMMGRYRALGLHADDGAFVPQASVAATATRATVTLTRQVAIGDIRYTIDGSAPTPTAARYDGPVAVTFPARFRAASFAGPQPLSREIDLPLDTVAATRRVSQQLDRCTDKIVLNLPGKATGGSVPTYLIDIRNPCWIYRDADLSRVRRIAVSIAALPFNYQFADEATRQVLPPTATPSGELTIRRRCDGPLLATVPLASLRRGGFANDVTATIGPQTGRGDLCLTLARPTLDPIWALGRVELRP